MTIRFSARVVGVQEDEDLEVLSAGVAEYENGTGEMLLFQCGLYEPEEQDIALGMDSYCLVTADQGTAYGSVTGVSLHSRLLRVVVAPEHLDALGLDDTDIEVGLDVDEQDIERLREGLRRILVYGRQDARPAVMRL